MSTSGESWEFGYEYKQGFFPEEMVEPDQDDYMRLEAAAESLMSGSPCELTKSYGFNLNGDICIEFGNRYHTGEDKIRPYICMIDAEEELICELELVANSEILIKADAATVFACLDTALDSGLLNSAERTATRYLQSVLLYKHAEISFDQFVDRHGMSPDEARQLAQNLVDVAVDEKDVKAFAVRDVSIVHQHWVGNVLVRLNDEDMNAQDEPWLEIDIESVKERNQYEFLIYPDGTVRLEVARIDDDLNYIDVEHFDSEGKLNPDADIADEMIMFLELFTAPFKQDIQFLAEVLEQAEIATIYGPPNPNL